MKRDFDCRLLLIRHSLPEILPARPANQWTLSVEGRVLCERLAQKLAGYRLDRLVTSLEPKALETGQIVADLLDLPVETASNLHEHSRNNVPFLNDGRTFEAEVARLLAEPAELVFGDETGDEAYRRFARALEGAIAKHPTENLGVVSHGTVIALYVSRVCGLDGPRFWKRLGLPSFVVLAQEGTRLVEVVEDMMQVPWGSEPWPSH